MLRRSFLISLQVVVTTAAILYVFHDPGKRAEIGGALRRADKTWIALDAFATPVSKLAATVAGICCWGFNGFPGLVSNGRDRNHRPILQRLFFPVWSAAMWSASITFSGSLRGKIAWLASIVMDRLLGLLAIVS